MASKCDMLFVIGSRNSSNSVRLVEVAKKSGCQKSILIHSDQNLPIDEIKKCKNNVGKLKINPESIFIMEFVIFVIKE